MVHKQMQKAEARHKLSQELLTYHMKVSIIALTQYHYSPIRKGALLAGFGPGCCWSRNRSKSHQGFLTNRFVYAHMLAFFENRRNDWSGDFKSLTRRGVGHSPLL